MTFKNTPEQARALWVQALRSGDYKQTTGSLHDEHGYCCLGVACVVYQEHVGDLKVEEDNDETSYNNENCVLPVVVRDWLGLRAEGGSYVKSGLVTQNDSVGADFDAIADIIEREPIGLLA